MYREIATEAELTNNLLSEKLLEWSSCLII